MTAGHSWRRARVNPNSGLNDERTLDKLEIQRRFRAARKVGWGIVTECDLPLALIDNLEGLQGP